MWHHRSHEETFSGATVTTVDDYIATFPPHARKALREIRRTVRAAAPKAHEVISYRIPALRQCGILVYYAAFKNHVGFFPPIRGNARLEKAASVYAGEKGNLRFPLDEPMPLGLIRKLTQWRARQDAAAEAARRSAKSKKKAKKKAPRR